MNGKLIPEQQPQAARKIRALLRAVKLDRPTDKALMFDEQTGNLVVARAPRHKSIVLDLMYRDGFFALKGGAS